MKILMINVVCGIRSTGRICTDLACALEAQGHDIKIAYGRESVPEKYKKYAVRIGSDIGVKLHAIKARFFDDCGWGSKKDTEKFIEWVKKFDPDVIHLHNLHGYYINLEILFDYLKTCGKKILWTLHDCWAFTGHAAYCEAANCEKWLTGCDNCPNKSEYPASFVDNSRINWQKKKELFQNIPNLSIVTPSKWLSKLVKRSFLSKYPITVIHNGIDTSIFKHIEGSSIQYLPDKKIVLGVAALWEARKGINDFIELSQILPKEYQVVLVGLSREQIRQMPQQIICIERTNSISELVKLYSAAYVYVNPTYEDNYPTTNIEAIACGTPVVTYDTGGSGESAEIYGYIIQKGNIKELIQAILSIDMLKASNHDVGIEKFVNSYLSLYNTEGLINENSQS